MVLLRVLLQQFMLHLLHLVVLLLLLRLFLMLLLLLRLFLMLLMLLMLLLLLLLLLIERQHLGRLLRFAAARHRHLVQLHHVLLLLLLLLLTQPRVRRGRVGLAVHLAVHVAVELLHVLHLLAGHVGRPVPRGDPALGGVHEVQELLLHLVLVLQV